MTKLLFISYLLVFIGLLCCRITKQEVVNDEQRMQVKEEPIKPYDIFKFFHIIDVPTKPCPEGQRRDIFGICRPIFNSEAKQEVDGGDQLMQDKQELLIEQNDVMNLLHVIEVPKKKPCLDDQKKDIFEECRPSSNFDFPQEEDDVERLKHDKQQPIKPHIIDVSIRPCPENQKKDIFGECRPVSNYDTKQEVDNDEPLMEDKVEPIKPRDGLKILPIIDVPRKPCPANQKRDIFGRCRPTVNYSVTKQEENNDDQLKQDKQEPIKPLDDLNDLHVINVSIKPCPENQSRDIFGECKPVPNYEINQEVVNSGELVNEEPIKRRDGFKLFHIISVPIKSCPENQKRDIFGNCRAIFK